MNAALQRARTLDDHLRDFNREAARVACGRLARKMTGRSFGPWIALVVVAAAGCGAGPDAGRGKAGAPKQRKAEAAEAVAGRAGTGSGAGSAGSVDELIGVWGQDFVRGPVSTGPIELLEAGGGWAVKAMGQEGACQPGPPPGAARAAFGQLPVDVLNPEFAEAVAKAAGKRAGRKPATKPGGGVAAAMKARLWCPLGDSGHGLRLVDGAPGSQPGSDAVRALWVQPAVPLVSRGGHASAATLRRQGAGRFVGEATLLATRFHVVLAIGKRPTGEVTAFLREREQNLGRLVGVMEVRRRGDEIELASASGMALAAKLVRSSDGGATAAGAGAGAGERERGERRERIELALPDSDIVLHLERLARGDAAAVELYAAPAPAYQAPVAGDDGWAVAAASEVGMSPEPLVRLGAELARQVPSTWSDLAVHSVVVARRGKLVFERYFAGYGPGELHDIRSVGKSYATTLLGAAIDRGELRLDSSVLPITGLPAPGTDRATGAAARGGGEGQAPLSIDPRWSKVKARHLASMSSGISCDDDAPDSPGNEDRVQNGDAADWHRATLALPMAAEPGSRGVYCTMGINLLGALLERQSAGGGWLPDLFVERVARPLQMSRYLLNLMPDGQGYLGGGLRLLPRDMAKLGQLLIDKGMWNGQPVVSESWAAQATARQASLTAPDDYGLGWWRTTFSFDRVAYPAFYASGNGGQLIIGIPSLEAVVVFTAGNYGNRRTWQRLLDDLMPRYVLPALLGRP